MEQLTGAFCLENNAMDVDNLLRSPCSVDEAFGSPS